MKLSELAGEPKLVEVSLDTEEIVAEYGEPLVFWTWDRQPMNVFVKLASVDENNLATVFDAVKDMILDEKGKHILVNKKTLPQKALMAVVNALVERLGK
jgi:hypothetical protein